MNLFFKAVFAFFFLFQTQFATAQTLGNYPNTTGVAGQNFVVSPSATPSSITSIVAYTTPNFTGLLSVNPTTGVVSMTNAKLTGTYVVTVKAFNGANSTTRTFNLTVTKPDCSQGLFFGSSISVGTSPMSVAVGDFNNDGRQDFASVNNGANTVSIRLGDGAGAFTGSTNLSTGTSPTDVAVADFNLDGRQDLAVVNSGSSNVTIFLGNGSGGFSNNGNITVGPGPYHMSIGDFNGDGRADFITTNRGNTSAATVSVRLGNGSGGFTNAPDITNFSFQQLPNASAVVDYNSDGKQDLAITTESPNEVTLFTGDGLGGFTRITEVSQRMFVGNGPVAIAMGDFNNNGAIDFVTANFFAGSISVRFGNGTGGFVGNSVYDFPVGQSPEHVAVADVNGDGNQDILVTLGGVSSGSVMVLRGNGTGTFSNTNSTSISPLTSPAWIATGDFNQDKRVDILIANKSSSSPAVSIRLGGINDINLQGNSANILDGDITPTVTDHTDFGTVNNGFARTFTIQNLGTTALAISGITSSNPQFTISGAPATVAGGGSATFQVTYNGTFGGAQTSTITIQNNDCDEAVYDFVVTANALPTLGNYPNITVGAADDTTLIPVSAPLAGRIFAYTDARFTGQFAVNPTSGVVRILNPQPAGTYTVTVKAFNGTDSVTKTFTLTVVAPQCSKPEFTSTAAQNLTVTVSPNAVRFGDFNNDGFQDIITSNGASSATLRLGAGNGTFGSAINISIGSAPRGVCIGDFNGDGNLDFACADRNGWNAYLRLGNGAGGFTNAPEFNAGSQPENITAADFNNDGKLDLAIANASAGTVSVGIGNGLGGFTAVAAIPVGTTPSFIATADFNNDGNTDLAVANNNASSVSIRLGNGLGGFTGTANISVGTNPFHLAVGDFNNDGKLDFASTSFAFPGPVSVRLGDGAGGFTNMPDLPVGNRSSSIAAADFNADGKLDLAIGESTTNSIILRTGDGAGNFAADGSVLVNSAPVSLAVGDVNNDGILDFVSAASLSASAINVRLGISTEIKVFGNSVAIAPGDVSPSPADHTDFGGLSGSLARTFTIQNNSQQPQQISSITSGNPQLVVSNAPTSVAAGGTATFQVTATPTGAGVQSSTITITSNACANRTFTFLVQATALPVMPDYSDASMVWGSNKTIPPLTAPQNASMIMAASTAKFGGVFSVHSYTGEIQISGAGQTGTYPITVVAYNGIYTDTARFNLTVTKPGCGPGVFTGTTSVTVGALPISVALGDFNRDNKQDVVSADFQAGTVSIRIGDGLGGFSGTTSFSGFTQPRALALADFNRDGAEDLAIASVSRIFIRNGNGIGGFNATAELTGIASPEDIAAIDVNQDGFIDLLVADKTNNSLAVFIGNGNSGFGAPVAIAVGAGAAPQALAVGNFNNDGRVDVAVANSGLGTVAILLGNGNGTFTAASGLSVGAMPRDISVGDFNGDNQLDLAIANNGSNNVSIRLGAGNGTFTAAADIALGSKPFSVDAGDFNGDGNMDLVTANNEAGLLAVRFGTGTGTFTGSNTISMNQPYKAVVGNFNGDGFQDLAVANFGAASVSIRLGTGNMIGLLGNNQPIPDGATTASSNNHTDFGILADTLQRTFTIQNTGTAPLVIDSIRSSNTFFIIRNAPTSVAAGGTAIFRVTYNFGGSGVQTSTIRVFNNNCAIQEYDFLVQATKANPPTLGNYPSATLSAGNSIIVMPDAAPVGANQITAYTTNGFPGTLAVDSLTGALRVVTANEPGTFTITIRARRGLLSTTKTCTLTVTNTLCGSGTFVGTTSIPVGNTPRDVVAGDFNQDGIPDLAVANYTSSNVSIRLGDGLGGFTGTETILVAPNPTALAVADFNGDGKQDLAISIFSTPSRSVSIRFGNGLGGFTGNTEVPIGSGFSNAVVAADFNQDGNMDFASANTSNVVTVHPGNGLGGFSSPLNINMGANTELRSIALGDFNNDGFPDLVAGLYQTNSVRIILNDGQGGFTANAPVTVGSRPNAVIAADFNADGKIDIATANALATSVSIRLGDGSSGLSGTTEVTGLSSGVYDLGAGDFNGDGKLDVAVVINSNFNSVNVRFGDGTGLFSGQLAVPAGPRPYGIAIGDWNKDGRQDLAMSNETGSSISIRMGDAGGDNIWLGITSDWGDPSNWSAGVGPGICTKAVINTGVPNMPTISGTQNTCGSLKLGNGATVNMAPGARLNITGK